MSIYAMGDNITYFNDVSIVFVNEEGIELIWS